MSNPTVTSVCRLPITARVRPAESLASLLEEARLTAQGGFPTEEEIGEALVLCPELIEPWLRLSEDQRVSEGWYLQHRVEGGHDVWEVGYYPTSAAKKYPNVTAATAAFIARYIGAVAVRGGNAS